MPGARNPHSRWLRAGAARHLPEFTHALNARAIMSNRVQNMKSPDDFPYCFWHPDIPDERTLVGRACAAGGYTSLYLKLDPLPDVAIAEEARDNRPSGQAIYKSIIISPIRWACALPGARPVDPVAVQLLCKPLPTDLPTVDKDILFLMAAWSGNIDRYARLRRPTMINGELPCVDRRLHRSGFDRPSMPDSILNDDSSSLNDSMPDTDLPVLDELSVLDVPDEEFASMWPKRPDVTDTWPMVMLAKEMDGTGYKDLTIVHEITIDQIGFEPECDAMPSAVERFRLNVCLADPSIRPSPSFEILDLGEIIRRFIALAVKVTLVGMDIYSVVNNPSSVVFTIFGYILSAGALTGDSKVSTAAKARRAMGERDLAKPSKTSGRAWPKSRLV
ncbi:hypothetical protein PENFLA_c021G02635 [Penicillium flavigenum]|uniref:Uncharacterized protein n=1 Tax=Penicillium flavigenum TaxID=254877 RepID=A0A1V6SX20_9EURO|nr:hypothetical protein PENFLA_c021G02635 [Penicillium flavigenum]